MKPLITFEPVGGPAPFVPGFTFPLTEEQQEFLRPRLQDLVREATMSLLRRSGLASQADQGG